MPKRARHFYVPSLNHNKNAFKQYMLTLVLLMALFSFGLAMSGKEIHLFLTQLHASILIFLELSVDFLILLYELVTSMIMTIIDILWKYAQQYTYISDEYKLSSWLILTIIDFVYIKRSEYDLWIENLYILLIKYTMKNFRTIY